jgi:hypothetical protein
MGRRLLLAGITAALLSGGWSGALAAVMCPHAGGKTGGESAFVSLPACCRKDDGETAHCPMRMGQSGDDHHQETAASHEASGAPGGPRRASVESASGRRKLVASARPADLCAHCVGSPAPPPAPLKVRGADAAKRGDAASGPRAEKPPEPPAFSFVRAVIPSQHGPPGGLRRHVLLSTFLI